MFYTRVWLLAMLPLNLTPLSTKTERIVQVFTI